ncbi:hypothetical protein LP419_14800 [Massilia sp. H-1]|nr:hypothetical protein LP419_14800 [Massilia sp. H-1]
MRLEARLMGLGTPFIIGEFQPWALTGNYGGQLTRKTYDIYNQYGWAATSWAYKTVSFAGSNGDTGAWGWGVVSNSSNGGAMGSINVSSASNAQIDSYFRAFGSQALVRNASVAAWMNWKLSRGRAHRGRDVRQPQGHAHGNHQRRHGRLQCRQCRQ